MVTMSQDVQEQLEARLTQKRSEVKSLNVKLEAVQRKLSQHTSDAELATQQTSLTMTQAQQQITQYVSVMLLALWLWLGALPLWLFV